jgi:hypothetical protein
MSTTVTDAPAQQRVREQAREVVAVMAVSAGLSVTFALAVLLLLSTSGQG